MQTRFVDVDTHLYDVVEDGTACRAAGNLSTLEIEVAPHNFNSTMAGSSSMETLPAFGFATHGDIDSSKFGIATVGGLSVGQLRTGFLAAWRN